MVERRKPRTAVLLMVVEGTLHVHTAGGVGHPARSPLHVRISGGERHTARPDMAAGVVKLAL